MTLTEKHLAEFRASGVPEELIAAAGIESVADSRVRDLLKWQPKDGNWGAGWAIPFRENRNPDADYYRVKLDFPRTSKGKEIKYESPKGEPNRAYIPPGFWEHIEPADAPIIVTEGEKKALCATAHRFACVGLVGVYGFQRKRNGARGPLVLLPELDRVPWAGRNVYICFDSDAETNRDIQKAENRLASLLTGRGAIIYTVRIPPDGTKKIGLDDFIVANGKPAFDALIEKATPTTPESESETPMELADALIGERFILEGVATARSYRGELYKWNGTHYRVVDDAEFVKRVLLWLDDRGKVARPRLAREVVDCVGARLLVPGDAELPI